MDYKTKPLSRERIRQIGNEFREKISLTRDEPFPVLHVLDKLRDLFNNCGYDVLEDDEFPFKTMGRTIRREDGTYSIEIPLSIYNGALKGVGAYRNHICHELAHVILFKKGYTPLSECGFENYELHAYESVEWQAKALCGELMMPYEATKNMSVREIVKKFGVSKESARIRLKY